VPDDHVELAAQRHAQPHACAAVFALVISPVSTVQPWQQWWAAVYIFG
jgi:hypothetical protein